MSGHSDDCEAGRGTEAKCDWAQAGMASWGAPAYSRMLNPHRLLTRSLSTVGLNENTNHKPNLTKTPRSCVCILLGNYNYYL